MSCGLPTPFKPTDLFIYNIAGAVSELSRTHGFVCGDKMGKCGKTMCTKFFEGRV